jgi:hypothetical protein
MNEEKEREQEQVPEQEPKPSSSPLPELYLPDFDQTLELSDLDIAM